MVTDHGCRERRKTCSEKGKRRKEKGGSVQKGGGYEKVKRAGKKETVGESKNTQRDGEWPCCPVCNRDGSKQGKRRHEKGQDEYAGRVNEGKSRKERAGKRRKNSRTAPNPHPGIHASGLPCFYYTSRVLWQPLTLF